MSTNTERPWLANYPAGVPSDIDLKDYASLIDLVGKLLQKYKNLPAYHSMGKELSFGEIDAKANAFGAFLQSRGLQKGDKIALMMPNILQYPIALFGAMRAGLIIVNTNPLYTAREIKHQFNDAGVKAVLVAENFAAELEKVIGETSVKLVITTQVGDMLGLKGMIVNFVVKYWKKMVPAFGLKGSVSFKTALAEGAGKTLKPYLDGQLDDTICIQYTGGTTGVAKGAELTNRNLIANMLQVGLWIDSAGLEEGKERMLTPLPMYHIFSFTVNCLCMAKIGAKSILIINPRDMPDLVKQIGSTRPTMVTGVNTLFNGLLNNEAFRNLDFKNIGMKIAVGGAMAVQRAVADRWQSVVGIPIIEGFGMTESSPLISVNPVQNPRLGTIGLPAPSTYVRIADTETGALMPYGERGEIQAQGPQIMKGYYNRPDETAKTITEDGWLRTGDIGIMEADGFVRIVDRLKNMILVSGFNVYPNEIEDVLATNPKILESAAIGIPDDKSGEAIKIFVVKKDDSLTEAEVLSFCKDKFTGYKQPRFVEFKAELPKTNVGKILHRTLREEEIAKRAKK